MEGTVTRDPPSPTYAFAECSRVADVFLGPEAETIAGTGAGARVRRNQVLSDLISLCKS